MCINFKNSKGLKLFWFTRAFGVIQHRFLKLFGGLRVIWSGVSRVKNRVCKNHLLENLRMSITYIIFVAIFFSVVRRRPALLSFVFFLFIFRLIFKTFFLNFGRCTRPHAPPLSHSQSGLVVWLPPPPLVFDRLPSVSTAASVFAQQYLFKRLSKDFIKYGIKYRIDHGAGVSQPRSDVKNGLRYVLLARAANGRQ